MKKLKRLIYVKLARRLSRSTTGAPVPTIISENSKIMGNIVSEGIVHVDGHIEGDITCEELVIGVKGSVHGEIKVANLQLFGLLKGKAEVNDLFVAKSAKLLGDASHNTIAIEPGAYIDGCCLRKTSVTEINQFSKDEKVVVAMPVKKIVVNDKSSRSKNN